MCECDGVGVFPTQCTSSDRNHPPSTFHGRRRSQKGNVHTQGQAEGPSRHLQLVEKATFTRRGRLFPLSFQALTWQYHDRVKHSPVAAECVHVPNRPPSDLIRYVIEPGRTRVFPGPVVTVLSPHPGSLMTNQRTMGACSFFVSRSLTSPAPSARWPRRWGRSTRTSLPWRSSRRAMDTPLTTSSSPCPPRPCPTPWSPPATSSKESRSRKHHPGATPHATQAGLPAIIPPGVPPCPRRPCRGSPTAPAVRRSTPSGGTPRRSHVPQARWPGRRSFVHSSAAAPRQVLRPR